MKISRLFCRLQIFIMTVLIMFGCVLSNAYANNIQVTNCKLVDMASDSPTANFQFDISWDNSWRFNSFSYDAAWVFVKYSVNDGAWQHAKIIGVTSLGTSGGSNTNLTIDVPSDYTGAFIYRASDGSGTLNTANVKLKWAREDAGVAYNATKIKFRVFGIEMVHIPQGAFYVGSGGTGEIGSFTDGFWSGTEGTDPTIPFKISSEAEITINTGAGNLWNTSVAENSTIGPIGTLPAAFPKGYKAFYCMKYEITQGQYRDFLNTLTRTQQDTRIVGDLSQDAVTNYFVMNNTTAPLNRNGLRCPASGNGTGIPIAFYCDLDGDGVANESNDGEWISCNYLSWSDLCSYADWAGLRPMSELEFEKVCRGPNLPVANEFAWGSNVINSGVYTLNNGGTVSETIATNYDATKGNVANLSTTTTIGGPVRCGIFADNVGNSGRVTSGASYYGIMDLTGNNWEKCVTVGEDTTGRLYTGLHGDGLLPVTGNADVNYWPGITALGVGWRGGSWSTTYNHGRVSDRYVAVYSTGGRAINSGGRLVRTQ